MKIMTRDEYMDDGGSKCPACGSEDIGSSSSLAYAQEVECYSCRATWWNIFYLSYYENLKDKDGNSLEV